MFDSKIFRELESTSKLLSPPKNKILRPFTSKSTATSTNNKAVQLTMDKEKEKDFSYSSKPNSAVKKTKKSIPGYLKETFVSNKKVG